MSWYYGTFSCGHEGRVNIVGPTGNRQWIADRKFEGLCPDCYKLEQEKLHNEKNEKAKKQSEELKLPELRGTDKQKNWANTLRVEWINKLESYKKMNNDDFGSEASILAKDEVIDKIREQFDDAIAELKSQTYASTIINNINRHSVEAVIKNLYNNYKLTKANEHTIPFSDLVYLEPESKRHEHPVVFNYNSEDSVITASLDEINKPFNFTVKGQYFIWNGNCWTRKICETTGTWQDRLTQIAVAVMKDGFAVYVPAEIKNNVLQGRYEPECTKWITAAKDDRFVRVCWRGKNDDAYWQSKHELPEAEWSKELQGFLVNIKYYKQIMEFAKEHDFKFTSKAYKTVYMQICNHEESEQIEK